MKSGIFIATLLLLASLTVQAAVKETEEFSFDLAPGGRISLENINGDIRIEGGSGEQVSITAFKKAGKQEYMNELKIIIEADDDHINIETRHPKSSGINWGWGNDTSGSVRYEITVPSNVNLDSIETINGEVEIIGVDGRVAAEAVNGDITATGLKSDAQVETVNGKIAISFDQLTGTQRVSADTVNGKITVQVPADASARVNAETVNGGIDADDFGLEAEKGFVGRDLEGDLGGGDARLSLETVNGGIRIEKN